MENENIPQDNKLRKKRINDETFFKLLDVGVKLFWFVFAVIIFKLFYPQIKHDIIPNLTSFKFAGIKASIKKDFDRHNNKYFSNAQFRISPKQQEIISRRSQTIGSLLAKTKILWVDDTPDKVYFYKKNI